MQYSQALDMSTPAITLKLDTTQRDELVPGTFAARSGNRSARV